MSAAGVITDTMANIRTAKDASGKEYNYKFNMTGKLFVRQLVKAYIKSPEKFVLKEWSDDHKGRKSPMVFNNYYEVYLNKGHPEGAKPGGFHNSAYGEGLHYNVSETETRFIYRNKTDDWKTDLINAAKDAGILPVEKLTSIEEAIKSLGHFAWRWSNSDDTKKINYEVESGATSFIVKLDNYPAYIEEFEPLKGYKIFYNDFRGEGYVYMGGGKNPYLVVQTPTSSKERADDWLEKVFGSDLVFNPDRTFRENIHYTKK